MCEKFPGHIALQQFIEVGNRVPLVHQGETKLVLDIDSDKLTDFDVTDQKYLEQILGLSNCDIFQFETR